MGTKNPGRADRRKAAREAARKDGKQRTGLDALLRRSGKTLIIDTRGRR